MNRPLKALIALAAALGAFAPGAMAAIHQGTTLFV